MNQPLATNPLTATSTDNAAALRASLAAATPLLWCNPARAATPPPVQAAGGHSISLADVEAAQARFARFAPLLSALFPELAETHGVIESPLVAAASMQAALGLPDSQGRLWVKADHSLPVAGSIKARGGIHEVLEFAENLALRHGLLGPGRNGPEHYLALGEPAVRALFGRYQVAVGSTGNLGLSIGVMASALGFRAAVHMSSDAKAWKKARLRNRGVEVVEHAGDYEDAVAAGRRQAQQDEFTYFVDDERSLSLLLGYSAAALHLRQQLAAQAIPVDADHPLFVYLPCGVGGAPAGITFGMRQLFGPHVHCVFAEPTQSPCFLVQMMAGTGNPSVYDFGLSNRTQADGLAVPRASELAAAVMRPLLSGVFTVADDTLFEHLAMAWHTQGLRIEPSAAAGFSGPRLLCESAAGRDYLARHQLEATMPQATHLVWTTGGLFVPPAEYQGFLDKAAALAA
ncbi:D-serine ammonia-lyase [Cupriavidus basilensis]|uniref:Probable D-serine dehydratase n=1 Tax=Cupriavidus basilensis TaxID=68895 RepID=A0A643G0D8_9BURK|nr:D-serine ammonia-lyase [Cupriavidus basilensis]QOT78881.1 D-serine ammonia-lyase [Cupriavidus basilensis]